MDNLMKISEILSSCLTTEAVQSLCHATHTEMVSPTEEKGSLRTNSLWNFLNTLAKL